MTDGDDERGQHVTRFSKRSRFRLQLVDAFLLSLRSSSAFDAMLPWMKVLPLRQQIVVASGGATAAIVAEGTPKR